ncbi:DNA-deoxyinosine glycosylase [Clostridia bacterium]|nr:DNA-deoxyinosine glycosylase [Clostridia bacterium]
MDNINSFEPIIDSECNMLILGSIPGIESLNRNEYYAHPRNTFWQIMFQLLNEEMTQDYQHRVQILLHHHIGLWDVIGRCSRKGSLDSNIRQEEANDFETLFRENPKIEKVFFNGAKAYDTYRKKVGFDTKREYHKLPSTSPAHAITFAKKFAIWESSLKLK